MKTLRIFFSSPSDVAEERTIAHRVVRRLQVEFAGAFRFETVIWEREPLLATAGFQEQIELPSEADIFVAMLWSRLGTPLSGSFVRDDGSRFLSGTEYEFEDAFTAFQNNGTPRILVYRKTATPIVALDDEEAVTEHLRQKKALDAFLARWFGEESDGALKRAVHGFASSADFEELLEVHLRKLIDKVAPDAGQSTNREASWTRGSPFRGLEAFGFDHAAIFFGRTRAVASVLDGLRKQAAARRAFVLVVGASGGGKSSLVRAGVVPMLVMPGVISGISEWRRAIMRPSDAGGRPIAALANALCRDIALPELRDTDGGSMELRERFERDEYEGLATVHAALNAQYGRTRKLVLVIDQLEELFGPESITDDDRTRFMAIVDALARSGSVWIIATVRSDFYPRCIQLPLLVGLKEGEGQFDLQPPTRPEIGQMIRLPAESAGLSYETDARTGERLDEKIRDDTADNPKALPLLEFTLQALYEQRTEAGALTFKAYRQIGGLEGSLARRAETVYRNLPRGVRAALPEVLDALAAPADSGGLRRKRARLAEFVNPDARTMVRAFVDARLFAAEMGDDEEIIVDVAHEALLDHWPRVLEWATVNQEILQAHRRLGTATRNWLESGRSRDLLLQRGRPIAEARMLMARDITLDRNERAFIDASLQRSRQLRWLSYGALASIGLFAIVAAVAAWLATAARDEAESRRTEAQAMVTFMVRDLRQRLEPIGRLDLLDSVISTVLAKLRGRDPATLTDDELSSLGYALRQQGEVEDSQGNREAALAAYRESLAIFQEQHRRNPDDLEKLQELGRAWAGIGYVFYLSGDYDDASPAIANYVEIARRLTNEDPTNETYLLELNFAESDLGAVEMGLFRNEEALTHFETSAEAGRRLTLLAPDNLEYKLELSETLSWLSSLQETLGDFRASLRTREEAATLIDRLVEQAPEDMRWRNARARNRYLQADLLAHLSDQDALPHAESALDELTALVEHDPQNTDWQRDLAYAHAVMSQAYYQFRRPGEALAHADTAVQVADTLLETDSTVSDWRARMGRGQLARGRALGDLGRPAEALASLEVARDMVDAEGKTRFLLASLTLAEARIRALSAPDGGDYSAALTAASENLALANARDQAVWAEASLRSGEVAAATATVSRLLGAGYRERDFLAACAGLMAECGTFQAQE